MSNETKTPEQRIAELEEMLKAMKEEAEKDKKKYAKLLKKKQDDKPIDVPHKEHTEDEVDVEPTTTALQKVVSGDNTAVTVADVTKELATIAQNAIAPLVQAAKDNPGTALAIVGASTTASLFVANKLGYTDFNPLKLVENVANQVAKLGKDEKKRIAASPSAAAQEAGVADLCGPPCTQDEMREALLEQRSMKFGSNDDLIPVEQGQSIDRSAFKVSNVVAYYNDGAINHRIVIGHKITRR